jgi:hypothetical protein
MPQLLFPSLGLLMQETKDSNICYGVRGAPHNWALWLLNGVLAG